MEGSIFELEWLFGGWSRRGLESRERRGGPAFAYTRLYVLHKGEDAFNHGTEVSARAESDIIEVSANSR